LTEREGGIYVTSLDIQVHGESIRIVSQLITSTTERER
jgi:hypothetical protein